MRKKKERKTDMKDERVSVRCTSKEKEILNNRAEQLGLNLSGYVKKVLFPKKRQGYLYIRKNLADGRHPDSE